LLALAYLHWVHWLALATNMSRQLVALHLLLSSPAAIFSMNSLNESHGSN
jgi:hypothetical protein